jgi:hypothetical protein
MNFPENARLGLTLYFKSPSLGKMMFIGVDASPDDGGEVEQLPEGIAELTRRWRAALNRMHKVKDFRAATREEVVACLQQHHSIGSGRAAIKPTRRSRSAAPTPRAASASGMQRRLRELSTRYLARPRRALARTAIVRRAPCPLLLDLASPWGFPSDHGGSNC